MRKQFNKLICLSLVLVMLSFHLQAQENKSSDWTEMYLLLTKDVEKEIDTFVSPPVVSCMDPGLSRTITSEDPPPEPPSISDEALKSTVRFIEEEMAKPLDEPVRMRMKTNYEKLGGDPIALAQALCFFDKNKNTNFKAAGDPSRPKGIKIDNQRYITIQDLNAPLYKSRYYVIDMETGKINTYFSGHGYGGKKGVPESDMFVEAVSNISGSHATPRGFFITGTRRNGSSDPRWKYSMKLHGLQEGVNDKSFARAVIVHPFPKVPVETASSDDLGLKGRPIESTGPFGLSQGCPMLSEKHASEIIDKTKASSSSKGGSLFYNYSAEEKSRGAAYCGDEGLMKK